MSNILAQNKKAAFNYFLEEKFEAGMVLVGSEVKSVKAGHVSMVDSFITIKDEQAVIKKLYIKAYENASLAEGKQNETRERVLLLKKQQIRKLKEKSEQKGYTIVPTKIYITRGLVKVEIALAKGKHTYDKKETQKERDLERQAKREGN
ncbi:MAG: SsrA-binding protein SmpB [Firmicutes bacterium]|nr:SsrA-binding protein SmpB [Bacillota bacterium]MCL2771117.1 SsrA-binding protein SmpB [Bacillota bacterium]